MRQACQWNRPRQRSRPNFLLHLHPPTIPAEQARWSYTLGTGGLAIFLFLVLLVTEILEMFYYIPQPDRPPSRYKPLPVWFHTAD